MTHVKGRVALALVVCACLSRYLLSQTSSTPAQTDAPTFRSGVEAVAFEVFVTDAAGKPVTDLTVDDFELLEDRKPQPITTFVPTVIPLDASRGKAQTWGPPPDVGTNAGPAGRTYIMAIDDGLDGVSILRTRLFLRQFLERFFGPNDLGAVLVVGRGLATDGQAFTSNSQLLLKAIDKYSGGSPPDGAARVTAPASADAFYKQIDPGLKKRMSDLRELTESLAKLPGRKTLLYLTGGIGYDMFDAVDYRGGVMMLAAEDAHAVVSAATRSNIIFYPINPAGLSPGGVGLDNKMDFAALASVTGGFALSDSNSYMQTFERIQRESSAYYTIGFNSGHTKHDGRMVRVDVRVKRPGLTVKGREGYLAPLGERRNKEKVGDESPALDAMASAIPTRGVSMQVFAAPFRTVTHDAAVALAVDIDPDTLGFTEQGGRRTGSIEVTYSAVDTRKRAYLGGRHEFTVSLTDADYAEAQAHGLRVVSTLALPKGLFELRVGAASGFRTGSVVHHFEVPDFTKGRLSMSGLALTTDPIAPVTTLRPPPNTKGTGASVPCAPPSCIVPLTRETPSAEDPLRALATPAIARRTFTREEELVIFAEVYENGRQQAHRVTFTATLENGDHLVRTVASATRTTVRAVGKSTTEAFTLRTSLRDVAAGHYLLRAEAQSDVGRNVTAARAVPIEVR